jgi:hypothetical protein
VEHGGAIVKSSKNGIKGRDWPHQIGLLKGFKQKKKRI